MYEILSDILTFDEATAYLSILGSCASLFGLVLTGIVWWQIKELKNAYVSKATIPGRLEELEQIREKISFNFDGKFSSTKSDEVSLLIQEAHSILVNIDPKIKGMNKSQYSKEIKDPMESLNKHKQIYLADKTKDNARSYYYKLVIFLRSAKMLIKDYDWRSTE